ncbi:MAG: EAL domain-containing protein, partial [Butyrivibrio sp.]|nr:EAL domain-containing protein [Butyrivibrio sp.]
MDPTIPGHVSKNIDNAIKNGWIKVYYQPVVRSLTGQLCGAESLARWIDPQLGFLAPDKFIGALEESRQIHKLDLFMLEQVCSDISDRLSKHLPT